MAFIKSWWPMLTMAGGAVATALMPSMQEFFITFAQHNPELSVAIAAVLGTVLHAMQSPLPPKS